MKSKIESILINEKNIPQGLEVPTRIRSFSEIQTGVYSTIQRLTKKYPGAKIYYSHENPIFINSFLSRNSFIRLYENQKIDLEIQPQGFLPWELIRQISKQIEEDIDLSKDIKKWNRKLKIKSEQFSVVGKKKHLYLHPTANVYPNVVFDLTSGPIIIDKGVTITSFSFLEGPLYISPNAQIDGARITGGTIIGDTCKIGGEVENSIFGNFSNKHHEGFVGHSFISSWVNLGALSTTSDLKNNYGTIKIWSGLEKINTGTIKFGSIIGDFSKIAIGCMLNTGSVIDIGCNVVAPRVEGYTKPFSWVGGSEKYRLDSFLNDAKKIMARRDKSLSEKEEILLRNLYEIF
ncbi:MAG: glucose-1-phosphate thymidylyltransferase [Leptospiraceae bacterium]|nr:glucose-1-phosphate thymidylyltransferase [Leptospiraceae bacterium]MCK6381188.1 glucose-1-phosphate thymidylyltransferase [Leptospiraceae bacterium]NUM40456.1 glucose-1-phosphate thymidylyltransferase [Leptospiraceae bacterium]